MARPPGRALTGRAIPRSRSSAGGPPGPPPAPHPAAPPGRPRGAGRPAGPRRCSERRPEPVCVDASTHDDPSGLDRPGARLHEGRRAAPGETDHLAVEQELSARGQYVVGERCRHAREVDHGRLGRVQRADAGDMRLQLAEPLGADQLYTRDAARDRAAM